ncbi:hypothetical protein J5TS1_31940 [Bacillus licheniformis]|nr:hypothetical protein AB684_11120 [Bacillus licheniformis]EWH19975.1 hypothetical protein M769_0123850 [Bacillus haynesii]KND06135.1 hypothetical protein ACJ43_17320 [Bacillus paralicheniformis]OIS75674.1 hypothetical protein A4A38_10925 [Bacillus licheniformis]OIS77505.1 hypothetical protein A4A43_16705 [Bacillus licheniformis]
MNLGENYFRVLWNGTRVNLKFPTKQKAIAYINRRRAFNCEIQERTQDHKLVNSWIIHTY